MPRHRPINDRRISELTDRIDNRVSVISVVMKSA